VSYASDVARQLVVGGFRLGTLGEAYALIGAIAAFAIAATVYQFRKVVS